jgi:hypothetical protein
VAYSSENGYNAGLKRLIKCGGARRVPPHGLNSYEHCEYRIS